MKPEEVEAWIRENFEQNYEILKFEGGHALAENILQAALEQVIYYYRKLREIAEQVTETEVKLTLPNQKTPVGRPFTIEGVVDIVKERESVWMYDIKTHDPNYIRAESENYEKQLNVYAYIYQNIRMLQLDHTAIIATSLPPELQAAILAGVETKMKEEMEKWDPVIQLAYDQARVDATIVDFADVVDKIESCRFEPAEVKRLKERISGVEKNFATHVCRNCDARFSCPSYRAYSKEKNPKGEKGYMAYFKEEPTEQDDEQFLSGNIDVEKVKELDGIEEGIEGIVR
jgi:hypothetical protein